MRPAWTATGPQTAKCRPMTTPEGSERPGPEPWTTSTLPLLPEQPRRRTATGRRPGLSGFDAALAVTANRPRGASARRPPRSRQRRETACRVFPRYLQGRGRHSDGRYEAGLEADWLDKFHLLVLDDFSYVTKDQAETSVLFELISARYEQRSLLLTANQPFGEWDKIFSEPAMTVAAIDRLVHRATIFELNVESYRRRTAHRHPKQTKPAARSGCRGRDRRPDRCHTVRTRYVTAHSDHGFDERPATTALSRTSQGTAAAPALPQTARPQFATATLAECGTHPARSSG